MLPDMNSTASGGDESQRKGDDGINNKSGSEDLHNNSINNQELKRKRYHRHTPEQIQEMEANKHNFQFETWHEHHKNSYFRTENNELRAENMRCKEALSNARCRACGRAIPVVGMSSNLNCLRLENAQLREQIEYLAAILAKFVDKPLADEAITPSSTVSPTIDTEAVRNLKESRRLRRCDIPAILFLLMQLVLQMKFIVLANEIIDS
ncbi:UNVERIFIED_CONTAM: Homeobox-leucine zipper protein MERISTEM L1 [Sesamum latifolium]|uniref:Homeobox-leucine zipper protein MERISTEM L1 n=1 Tax=Sesamum latifolium TaxID=2727402 RepID=A0AAW2WRI2_9LAMI